MTDGSLTRIAMGIDYSTQTLHVAYGPGPIPFRVHISLNKVVPEERIIVASQAITQVLRQIEHRWPDLELSLMTIERPFMGRNVRTVISLAQIQAALLITCHHHKWFTVQEDPSVIRKRVLGVGGSGKQGQIKVLVQQWCKDEMDLDLGEDEADSVVIWQYAHWLATNA